MKRKSSMASQNLKKLRVQQNALKMEELITAEFLYDDCLLYIFKFLSVDETIKIELVCKNWYRVAQRSWNRWINFDFNEYLPYKKSDINDIEKKINTNVIMNIVKRAGDSIKKLIIYPSFENYTYTEIITNNLPKYCKNITELSLHEYFLGGNAFNDEILQFIFKENQNIKSLHLNTLRIDGDCLLNLNKNHIQELHLDYCRFDTKGYLYSFLGNLKNLNKFLINQCLSKVNDALGALILSECDDIFDINITSHSKPIEFDDSKGLQLIPSLSKFLGKQKKILKLKLENVLVDQQLLENLPTASLKELSLCYKNTVQSKEVNLNFTLLLSKQVKLQSLSLQNLKFNETIQINKKGFTSDNILEEISIKFSDKQSKDINSNLSLFLSRHNYYKLNLYNVVTDEKLLNSILTKNLKELNLNFINIKNYEILSKFFARLPNLQVFEGLFLDINNNLLREIIKHINPSIERIVIKCDNYLPPSSNSCTKIGYFNRLQNLKTFVILKGNSDNDDDNINTELDYILEELPICKNLDYFVVKGYHLTELEINAVINFSKLTQTHISHCYVAGDELVGNLIQKLIYLKDFYIEKFELVTKNLLKLASKLKREREDNHTLQISFIDCPKIEDGEYKDEPFVAGFAYTLKKSPPREFNIFQEN